MTEQELEKIEARANAATPGPWGTGTGYEQSKRGNYVHDGHRIVCAEQDETDCVLATEDAEFIAHARADVPALVAEVRRLQGIIAESAKTWTWKPTGEQRVWAVQVSNDLTLILDAQERTLEIFDEVLCGVVWECDLACGDVFDMAEKLTREIGIFRPIDTIIRPEAKS